jgi:hypothetical protein
VTAEPELLSTWSAIPGPFGLATGAAIARVGSAVLAEYPLTCALWAERDGLDTLFLAVAPGPECQSADSQLDQRMRGAVGSRFPDLLPVVDLESWASCAPSGGEGEDVHLSSVDRAAAVPAARGGRSVGGVFTGVKRVYRRCSSTE